MTKTNVILFAFLLFCSALFAQAGLSISPGKMYFHNTEGTIATQKLTIANPNNKAIEVGVSLGDWDYLNNGTNNVVAANTLSNSAADWIQVLPSSYFVIEPNEVKQIEIALNVPQVLPDDIPVHTAMVFFTQLNPGQSVDKSGAAIKVTVRMGLKVYHANQNNTASVEIVNMAPNKTEDGQKVIDVFFENNGSLWSDGQLKASYFNQQTGERITLNQIDFYSLPKDKRKHSFVLPEQLTPGNYTFIVELTYGQNNTVKVAEIDFTL
ncbi:fimbrial biogenesis chaperone [Myroides pelagicus]|uniref:Molecular chaperone n=1 Tax=Myroides pelagicus TaxID=270914 RepID=A0A7K1GQ64_9FLAO|nr:hypothetical protein [Myroides pelagicus]MTH30991.1 hypothetical protein [Myroides pelagicus]